MFCGVDEAGRGPVLGPMVVAGVAIDHTDEKNLRTMGVKDSKRLTPRRRKELAATIIEQFRHQITVVSAEDIDLLRQEMTLNVLEAKVFAGIIDGLGVVERAYVDSADTDEKTFARHITASLHGPVEITSRHKADDIYPVVSAASIIAKVERDRRIEVISQELGQDIGSGYPSDPQTIHFIEEWLSAHGDLPPHTRRSWKTASRLKNATCRKIEDYGER